MECDYPYIQIGKTLKVFKTFKVFEKINQKFPARMTQ
jgi:hypothetical protein